MSEQLNCQSRMDAATTLYLPQITIPVLPNQCRNSYLSRLVGTSRTHKVQLNTEQKFMDEWLPPKDSAQIKNVHTIIHSMYV